MSSMPIFYYWVKNVETNEERKITSSNYIGDVGEIVYLTGMLGGNGWKITDWTYEEEDWA